MAAKASADETLQWVEERDEDRGKRAERRADRVHFPGYFGIRVGFAHYRGNRFYSSLRFKAPD